MTTPIYFLCKSKTNKTYQDQYTSKCAALFITFIIQKCITHVILMFHACNTDVYPTHVMHNVVTACVMCILQM